VQVTPLETTSYTLTAVNDSGQVTAQTTLTVRVVVTLAPTGTVSLVANGIQQFQAEVAGSSNSAVTWSVQEGDSGGTVDGGLYRAPLVSGTFHVVAASAVSPSSTATALVQVARPPPGTLDSTFFDGGALVFDSPSYLGVRGLLAVDGGRVWLSYSEQVEDAGFVGLVAALTPEGTLDSTVPPVPGALPMINSMPEQLASVDGRLVIHLGNSLEARAWTGEVDTSFGTQGIATFSTASSGLAVSPNGHLVSGVLGSGGYLAARALTADGTYLGDTPAPASFRQVDAVQLVVPLRGYGAAADRVMVLGPTHDPSGDFVGAAGPVTGAALIPTDAGLPNHWDAGSPSSGNVFVESYAVDASGRVWVGAYSTDFLGGGVLLARFSDQGKFDSALGVIDLSSVCYAMYATVDIDSAGRMEIGCNEGVARLDANGFLDPTFGAGGIASWHVAGNEFRPASIAHDAHDRILVGGSLSTSSGKIFPVVLRFWP
jgi:hypothetical protein